MRPPPLIISREQLVEDIKVLTYRQVAAKHGGTHGQVYVLLKKYGLFGTSPNGTLKSTAPKPSELFQRAKEQEALMTAWLRRPLSKAQGINGYRYSRRVEHV